MKFDIIVGNPPYNKNKIGACVGSSIWQHFVVLAEILLNEDGCLCFVHPPGWRLCRYTKRNIRSSNFIFNNDIVFVKPGFQFPTNDVAVDVDYYVVRKSNKKSLTLWETSDGLFRINIPTSTKYLLKNQTDETHTLLNKILTQQPQSNVFGRKSWGGLSIKDETVTGDFVFVKGTAFKYTHHKHPHIHQFQKKVIMSSIRHTKAFYDDGKLGIDENIHYVLVKDEAEAKWIINLTMSKIFCFCQKMFSDNSDMCDKYKPPRWNSVIPLSMMKLSNEEITGDINTYFYEYFNLTPEEIEHIEKHVE